MKGTVLKEPTIVFVLPFANDAPMRLYADAVIHTGEKSFQFTLEDEVVGEFNAIRAWWMDKTPAY